MPHHLAAGRTNSEHCATTFHPFRLFGIVAEVIIHIVVDFAIQFLSHTGGNIPALLVECRQRVCQLSAGIPVAQTVHPYFIHRGKIFLPRFNFRYICPLRARAYKKFQRITSFSSDIESPLFKVNLIKQNILLYPFCLYFITYKHHFQYGKLIIFNRGASKNRRRTFNKVSRPKKLTDYL